MKKSIIVIILFFLLGLGSAYVVKTNLHKKVLGEDSKIVHLIEESLGHNLPLFDTDIKGKVAPNFNLPQLNGGTLTLSDYKGKLLVLNFWASWCPPCRAEIPGFIKMQEKYKDKNVSFIGIAIEDKTDVENYAKDAKFNYPVSYGVEESYKVSGQYGNPDGALPYTLMISPEQKILEVFNGYVNEDMLEEVIAKNLP